VDLPLLEIPGSLPTRKEVTTLSTVRIYYDRSGVRTEPLLASYNASAPIQLTLGIAQAGTAVYVAAVIRPASR